MRYFRAAITLGIISVILVSISYAYYHSSVANVSLERERLSSLLAAAEQRKDYGKKIEVIKNANAKLIALSRERGTDVDYEITLTDHDIARLMKEVASTYAGGMFFLEHAAVESTSAGITVAMKGFKLGASNP